MTTAMPAPIDEVRAYFDAAMHDQAMSTAAPGTPAWYADLAGYRYAKLPYLAGLAGFDSYAGRDLLDLGCGVGLDLARFARGGARVVGVDLSPQAVHFAALHLRQQGLEGRALAMNGEELAFADDSFDVVYSHGALPYAGAPETFVAEIRRVLRPGGTAIVMAYHRDGWLHWVSTATGVDLEHSGAPNYHAYGRAELTHLMRDFRNLRLVTERFPVPTRLYGGWKATVYNRVFVPAFNAIPRALTRRWGFHLMVWGEK